MINPTWKRRTILDIKHQDMYDIYEDTSGNTYDLSGNSIPLQQWLDTSTDGFSIAEATSDAGCCGSCSTACGPCRPPEAADEDRSRQRHPSRTV